MLTNKQKLCILFTVLNTGTKCQSYKHKIERVVTDFRAETEKKYKIKLYKKAHLIIDFDDTLFEDLAHADVQRWERF